MTTDQLFPIFDEQPQALHDVMLQRRKLLCAGAVIGAWALLAGCASRGGERLAELPHMRWPDPPPPPGSDRGGRVAPEPSPSRPDPLGRASGSGVSMRVTPRSAWAHGAPIPQRMTPLTGISRITVHHDGMPPVQLRTRADVANRLETIRKAHLQRHFGDIGYHFVVDPAGRVWQGRPLNWQGAHVRHQNERNLGVMVLGNFEVQRPTGAALASVDRFVTEMMLRHRVPLSKVRTHRELAPTACPGRNLQRHMVAVRSRGGALALRAKA